MKKANCAFCSYKDKEVIILNDNLCYAIVSKSPINKHHVLVIPKEHYKDFIELPKKLAAHIFVVTQEISAAVRKACKPDAIEHISDDDLSNTGINLMEHYKIHIIPRFKNDKIKLDWNRTRDPGLKARSQFAKDVKDSLE